MMGMRVMTKKKRNIQNGKKIEKPTANSGNGITWLWIMMTKKRPREDKGIMMMKKRKRRKRRRRKKRMMKKKNPIMKMI